MKTETLQFKVTQEERKLIEKWAKAQGTTVSRFVRGTVIFSMALDGNVEAIKIVAKDVGEKAFADLRRRFLLSKSEAETGP